VLQRLIRFGAVQARAMFGGYGLYHDGVMFGLISSGDGLFLRTDATTRTRYEALGLTAFAPAMGGRGSVMPYHPVPEPAFADPDALATLAREAWQVARAARGRRSAAATSPRQRRTPRPKA